MQRDLGNEVTVAIAAVGVLAFVIMFAVILSISGTGGDTPATPAAIIPTGTATAAVETGETAPPTETVEMAQPSPVTPATHTPSPTITATHTPSPTGTPLPTTLPTEAPPTDTPTHTPTPTPTPTLTATRTPRPTETSGIRPTPTGTRTAVPAINSAVCTPQAGWPAYTVRRGETLFMIASAVGSSISVLQRANCLDDINQIYAGQPLLVPRLPVEPPPLPSLAGDPDLRAEGCAAPSTQITNLSPGQIISGVFMLRGTASAPNFEYYKIEVRPDAARIFNFYSRSETPVENGELAAIDPAIFGPGLHWIKLTVISDAHQPPCVIPVFFR